MAKKLPDEPIQLPTKDKLQPLIDLVRDESRKKQANAGTPKGTLGKPVNA